jgi:hypothetical protein
MGIYGYVSGIISILYVATGGIMVTILYLIISHNEEKWNKMFACVVVDFALQVLLGMLLLIK